MDASDQYDRTIRQLRMFIAAATGACTKPWVLYHPVEMPSDEELFAQVQAGNKDAVAQLIDRHGVAVFGYLRRMVRSHETAEDLFQEAWMRVVQRCASFRSGQLVKPWIYQIALNLVRDHLRREGTLRRGRDIEHVELAGDEVAAPASDTAMLRDEQQALRTAVEKLPLKYRDVVALRYFEDLTMAEISQVIRRPEGTVKSRLSRGLKMLQEQLEKQK